MRENASPDSDLTPKEKRALLAQLLQEKINEPHSYPLSYGQERMWFLEQLDPGNPALNIPMNVRLSGNIDQAILERSLNEIIRRHDTLRTTFSIIDGQPVQEVVSNSTLTMTIHNLQGLVEGERKIEVERLVKEEAERPFDLSQAPLLRATLLQYNPKEAQLLLTMHHIVSDAQTVLLLIQEVMHIYEATVTGKSSFWSPSYQYKDFVKWQRQQLEGEVFKQQLAYWQETLTDAPTMPLLPTDRPRPLAQSFRLPSASHNFWLSPDLIESLRNLSRDEGVTLFVTLITAFKILLYRYTHQDDILIGVPTVNRNKVEFERLIGFCAGTLVLRSKLKGELSFRELLQQVRRTTLEAYAHQDLPFEKIMESLQHGHDREQSHAPLFQVTFNLLKGWSQPVEQAGMVWQMDGIPLQAIFYDIWFLLAERDEDLQGAVMYNADLFEPETITKLVEAYCQLLEQIVAKPELQLSEVILPPPLEAKAAAAEVQQQMPTLAITATFTAEPVEESLAFWLQELGIRANIACAPYNQVFQQLLDPASVLAKNEDGVNIVLVRFEDWQNPSNADAMGQIEQNVQDLIVALKRATTHSATPYLVCICPASLTMLADGDWIAFCQRMEAHLLVELAEVSGIEMVTMTELTDAYPVDSYYDPHQDELGHIPYTRLFFTVLGTMIVRKIQAIWRTPYKVIILDCDQTLWQGICAEDGPQKVIIDPAREALQAFMVAQYDAGMLLCLCSKNHEEDVMAVFAQHPEMPLKREHIVSWRINWQSKSENIRFLAEELQLGLDSFVFIDDNPIECAEVRANCPKVLTLQLPPEASSIPHFLKHVWAFDHLNVTEEDRKRTVLYQQNNQRERWRQKSLTLNDFLAGLDLEVEISEMAPHHLNRVAQLTQRTNQFNFTTIRRSENEIQQLVEASKLICLVTEVSDRFGDYGLVGVILFELGPTALQVDTFLLSCRALGRGVEHQMLTKLAEIAIAHKLDYIEVTCVPTERNQPALDFLSSFEPDFTQSSHSDYRFRIPAAFAVELTYDPSATGSVAEGNTEAASATFPSSVPTAPTAPLNRIATELDDAEQILNAIKAQKQRLRPDQAVAFVAPRTPTEVTLTEIWIQILGVDQVGIYDNFFELGGHSMLGTLLMSRIRDAFQVELPLFTLFEEPTVAGLAEAVEQHQIEQANADEIAEILEELHQLSDDEVKALLADG
ncbi:HAD-IIIC family phosphatase [Chloroflexota bacterium]